MADAYCEPQPETQYPARKMDSTSFPSKRRKTVGQCPTCLQSFASRHELSAHMSDPHHAPVSDSDAISFGELSSDYDSPDESSSPKPSLAHEHEPTLDADGFEFSSEAPSMQDDGFEFTSPDADTAFFPSHTNAEQGSIHTLPDSDVQPSAEYTPIETPPRKARQVRGGALGVLYCGTCDKYFGNESVFKRHFMFGPRHGEEPQDMRELYYKIWASTWKEGKMGSMNGKVEQVDDMEM